MSEQKTAIITDSGTDVPQEYQQRYGISMLPLKIIYRDREYSDRVDITPEQVYERLPQEVPKTSLPDGESVRACLSALEAQGYAHVLCVTISSGLSGTGNLIRMVAREFPALDCRIIDTKSIGIGAGLQAIYAGALLEEGKSVDEVCALLLRSVEESRVFFCIPTLEYLRKGGRIGHVAAMLGSILNLKPIISCNAEGAYYTAAIARGQSKAIAQAVQMVLGRIKENIRYSIAVAHGAAPEKAKKILDELRARLPDCRRFIFSDVSPALGVHTGPGLVGICIQTEG